MGEVWLAHDGQLDRRVALKLIKHDDEAEAARFRREAQLAARLSHPNICAVYEADEGCIAMQYVEGHTLKDFPKSDVRAVAGLMRDAALAVQYAHDCGIVHRDIKPANLMVESAAKTARAEPGPARHQRLRLFVMDFGLAKQLDAKSSLSATGLVVGTPSYMPPEQAEGDAGRIGPHSDVYSLGATLYDLLAGRPPHQGTGVYDTLRKVVEEEPPFLGTFNARIDPDLAVIVHKAIAKEPERRYRTAAALAEDLDRWLNGEAIVARLPSPLERLARAVRKHRAAVTTAVVILVLSSVAVGWLGWTRIRATERAQAAAIERLRAEARAKDAELAQRRAEEERRRIEADAKEKELERLRFKDDMDRAVKLYEDGKFAEADALTDALMAKQPGERGLWGLRGLHLMAREDFLGALPHFEKLLSAGGNATDAANAGYCCMKLKRWDDAARWYRRAWAGRQDPTTGNNYVYSLVQIGGLEEAEGVVRDARKLNWEPQSKREIDGWERWIRAAREGRK